MSKDYYKTLGVSKDASQDEIKKAFRKLAAEHHPDKKTGNEAKFKEANEAYQTLGDAKKRAQYDQFGSAGPQFGGGGGQGGFGGFNWEDIMRQAGQQGGAGAQFDFGDIDIGDIFGAFGFGGGGMRRGRNIQVEIRISFKDSVFGVKRDIEIPELRDGKQGGKKKVTVDVPAGIDDGQSIRYEGLGEQITNGRAGNLLVNIEVERHPTFRKEGMHLVMDLPVKLADAILGAEYTIETLDGKEKVKIPAGLQMGTVLRVRGKGVQGGTFQKGDLLIRTRIAIPEKLSKKAKELVEHLKKELE